MGFFSRTCAKTHMPILTVYREGGFKEFSAVVALLPTGEKIIGDYDGYGRILVDGNAVETCNAEIDGYTGKAWDSVKFVLQKAYEGETYDQLGKSGNELAQGYFMDNAFLRECVRKGKFSSYAEYKKYFKKLAGW